MRGRKLFSCTAAPKFCRCSSVWSERLPCKQLAGGSNPSFGSWHLTPATVRNPAVIQPRQGLGFLAQVVERRSEEAEEEVRLLWSPRSTDTTRAMVSADLIVTTGVWLHMVGAESIRGQRVGNGSAPTARTFSSTGRAAVLQTAGWGFKSLRVYCAGRRSAPDDDLGCWRPALTYSPVGGVTGNPLRTGLSAAGHVLPLGNEWLMDPWSCWKAHLTFTQENAGSSPAGFT